MNIRFPHCHINDCLRVAPFLISTFGLLLFLLATFSPLTFSFVAFIPVVCLLSSSLLSSFFTREYCCIRSVFIIINYRNIRKWSGRKQTFHEEICFNNPVLGINDTSNCHGYPKEAIHKISKSHFICTITNRKYLFNIKLPRTTTWGASSNV